MSVYYVDFNVDKSNGLPLCSRSCSEDREQGCRDHCSLCSVLLLRFLLIGSETEQRWY